MTRDGIKDSDQLNHVLWAEPKLPGSSMDMDLVQEGLLNSTIEENQRVRSLKTWNSPNMVKLIFLRVLTDRSS